jgi:hypothetical protein
VGTGPQLPGELLQVCAIVVAAVGTLLDAPRRPHRPMQRFKRLAHDTRNYLLVAPERGGCLATREEFGSPIHSSLACAAAAARPGDTILLLPGVHSCRGVVLGQTALRVIGCEASVLQNTAPGEPALHIRCGGL